MRNFNENEVGVFNVADKPMPFRKKLKTVPQANYASICAVLAKEKTIKTFVIDDSQYLLCFELFRTAKETGYTKFTNMALNFYNLIQFIIKHTPADCIVYFLHHAETIDGKVKAKTIGKMLDEKLTVEGLFSIVLYCVSDGISHKFITQTDGKTTAKSPMEMFPLEIDNDLKMVDDTIREYYGLNKEEKHD